MLSNTCKVLYGNILTEVANFPQRVRKGFRKETTFELDFKEKWELSHVDKQRKHLGQRENHDQTPETMEVNDMFIKLQIFCYGQNLSHLVQHTHSPVCLPIYYQSFYLMYPKFSFLAIYRDVRLSYPISFIKYCIKRINVEEIFSFLIVTDENTFN